ncbi:MAG: FG-GAP-like repeat-containing protein, partial [Elusimicrobiota bacterium]|nr:FG-GAP-like repeat-containing protein [Elusimicrobiota bacterium]
EGAEPPMENCRAKRGIFCTFHLVGGSIFASLSSISIFSISDSGSVIGIDKTTFSLIKEPFTITISGPVTKSVTATEGHTFTNLPAGTYTVTASKSGMKFTSRTVNLTRDLTSLEDLVWRIGTYEKTISYSGTVYNIETIKNKKISALSKGVEFPMGIGVGDINGDGKIDVLLGCDNQAYLFYYDTFINATSTATAVFYCGAVDPYAVSEGSKTGTEFGRGIACGDFDGDGKDDILISAPNTSGGGKWRGEIYLYSGGNYSGYVSTASARIKFYGANDYDSVARWTMAFGDINGDGKKDIVIADRDPVGGTKKGAIYIFYGPKADGTYILSSADCIIYGGQDGDKFGTGLACSDINNDGKDDIVTYAELSDSRGEIYIFYGGNLTGTKSIADADVKLTCSQPGLFEDGYDISVNVGDFDGDKKKDLIVATGRYSVADSTNIGRVCVYYNSKLTGNINPENFDIEIKGISAGDKLGSLVSSGVDLDNDGKDELIISAQLADAGGVARGEAYIFKGKNLYTGMSKTANESDVVIQGSSDLSVMGGVGCVDLDKSGFADLVCVSFCWFFGETGVIYVINDLLLKEVIGKYNITGYVRNSGGTGISGVTVTFSGVSSGTYNTGETGYYEFLNLESGNYTVTPTKTGWKFEPVSRSTSIVADISDWNFTGTYLLTEAPVKIDIPIGIGDKPVTVKMPEPSKAKVIVEEVPDKPEELRGTVNPDKGEGVGIVFKPDKKPDEYR